MIVRGAHLVCLWLGLAVVGAACIISPIQDGRVEAIMGMVVTARRRPELDWLRVLSILIVFVFHSGRFFDTEGWHIKNGQTYQAMTLWATFLLTWMMPLIFTISGASVFFSLGGRSPGAYARERVLRLLVPFVVGVFTHIPLQVYLERLTHRQFTGTFVQFVPRYFRGFYGTGGNFAWMGLHLWYLLLLFILSILLFPLLFWLRRGGARALERLGGALAWPGAMYALALPVSALLAALDPNSALGMHNFGGWSPVIYIAFFLYGFAIVAHDRLERRVRQCRWISLALAIVAQAAAAYLWRGGALFGTPRFLAFSAAYGLAAWCWILCPWGLALQGLTRSTRWLSYVNEAVLPFYILHQTVLLGMGYYVVRAPIPDWAKFLAISLGSFAIISALYGGLIRRWNVLRILFGMRPRPRQAEAPDVPTH